MKSYHDRKEAIGRGEEVVYQKFRSKAIRVFCIECMGGYEQAPAECTDKACALYPFRLGPARTDNSCKLADMGVRP